MKKQQFLLTFFIVFLISCSVFAQNKGYTKHTVLKGESIKQIAEKYKVTPYDIYKLNPDSQSGIQENSILLIPSSIQKSTPASVASKPISHDVVTPVKPKYNNTKTHIVTPKETLYSISKEYNISIDDLKKLNQELLVEGLKIGQIIKIPTANGNVSVKEGNQKISVLINKKTEAVTQSKSDKVIYHIVEPKETKFGISKKYGLTVSELEVLNPEIVSNLSIGLKLIVSGNPSISMQTGQGIQKPKPVVVEIVTQEKVVTEVVKKQIFNGFANYEVKPKETLFSLAQTFDITQDELMILNPSLKDGLKIGMILKVPGKGSLEKVPGTKVAFTDLTKTITTDNKKQLVLLFPFNASKIQSDTLKSLATRLKNDAFLNMTLDFYSGALMAIDSAKVLGLNIDVRIFDSEESKYSSNVSNIVKDNNLEEADAIIGPFYQQYVESVAALLNHKKVPIISPLSKDLGKAYSNLYQAIPTNEYGKTAMFNFMMANNGNIIIVSDPKKLSNKEFITKNYPAAQYVPFNDKGVIDLENLRSILVKSTINYVVLDTEKTSMILNTTKALLDQLDNFQIQIVIIEPNDTLDFEEITMKQLTTLKLLYPTLTRDNNTPEAIVFGNDYKSKNKIFPSQFAIRGFDVTFDTLLRLSQEQSFEDCANDYKTEQIESMFDYTKNDSGGYCNKGIYIMEYQEDLSVKQVN